MDSSRSVIRELDQLAGVADFMRLNLVFGSKKGRTIIRHAYAEVPFKITRLYYPENSSLAQLIIMNTTAGLFPGDRTAIHIRVEAGARVLVTSQASTKVHPGKGVVEQSLLVEVEPDAELHIYNDPLIPYRGAHLRQRIDLEVLEGARLRFWEGFMAGRISRGECWQFDKVDAETRLVHDRRLLYLERYKLTGLSKPGNFPYVGTGIFYEPTVSSFQQIVGTHLGIDEPAPGLTIVRTVANSGVDYRRMQNRVLAWAFECRNERMPDLRKY